MDLPAAADEDMVVVPEMPAEPVMPPPVPSEAPAEEPVLEDAADFIPAADPVEAEDPYSSMPEADPYSAMPDPVAETENALTVFMEEWNRKLEEKRAAEYELEKQVRSEAEEELRNWNTQREMRLKAKAENNRTEEQVLVEQTKSEADSMKTWDRVSKLIAADEGVEAKGADTSRMRKLFIQLKNEPLELTRAASQ